MVTPGTNSHDSVCLKHSLLQLSSPTTQHPTLRRHLWSPRAAPQHSQLPGTSRPWWGQRTYIQLLPSTEMPFMSDSWGCLVATVSPKRGPEALRDQIQIFPRSSDGAAIGPARHQASSLVPIRITAWLHSQLAALDQRQKSWLLDSTGGLPLRHKINPSVAPCGRRNLLVGSLQFHRGKNAQWIVLLPKPSLPLGRVDQTAQMPPCAFHSQPGSSIPWL